MRVEFTNRTDKLGQLLDAFQSVADQADAEAESGPVPVDPPKTKVN